MATQRELHPVARLLEALEAEKIRYMLIGMSAAIVQGVMETTLGVDLWIDLPPRQDMRVQNIARRIGASMGANTVAYLEDGTPVNFVFGEVTGLGPFNCELRHISALRFHGKRIPVLKLERILISKEATRRDKDLAHIVQIRELLRCRRALSRRPRPIRKRKTR